MAEKVGVLFLFAQQGFGADAAVHADIIRNLDRDRFTVHVACSAASPDDSASEPISTLRTLSDVHLRETCFAPSLGQRDLQAVLGGVRSMRAFSSDFLALRKYIVQHGIRIVHSPERPRDAAYNVALAKLSGARSVVHVHVKWSNDYSGLARWGVQRADAVFSISKYVTTTLLEMGRPERTIHTVLNGIDPSRWDASIDGSELRRELGIAGDALVLASVSRLFSWKGQRELIRALALVRAQLPKVHLLIVGADSLEAQGGSFSEELKTLAHSLGVADAVTFTGPRADVPRVMAACDVFTMPSFEEPFGLVFLEAMAMKRPVVAIDNGGTPEVIEHGRTGLLSAPWDVPALAANILTLSNDPALRARFGDNGRARVVELFSAHRMARDVASAYTEVLR
ncbi:MAG TPA: glycosyltransferase family 4 protein [Polyangiaceae bacterium]|nr:glycosyltransferase family 4 protein [Polyangiaceae bacterium]